GGEAGDRVRLLRGEPPQRHEGLYCEPARRLRHHARLARLRRCLPYLPGRAAERGGDPRRAVGELGDPPLRGPQPQERLGRVEHRRHGPLRRHRQPGVPPGEQQPARGVGDVRLQPQIPDRKQEPPGQPGQPRARAQLAVERVHKVPVPERRGHDVTHPLVRGRRQQARGCDARGERLGRRSPARDRPGQAAYLHVPARGELDDAVAEGRRAVSEHPQLLGPDHAAGQPDPGERPVCGLMHLQRPRTGVGAGSSGSVGLGHEMDGNAGSCRRRLRAGGGTEEAGANPARSRHCHRGANPSDGHCPAGWEGRGERRAGSQETPAVVTPRDTGRGPRGRYCGVPVVLLLSTSDTDLLSARASGKPYRLGNPARLSVDDLPDLLDGTDLVVVRLLGGRRAWEEGLGALLAGPRPVVVLGGEQVPDAELMELSTVSGGVCAEAHAYLAYGGPRNLAELHAFLCDTLLLTGYGFAPPQPAPTWGVLEREARDVDGPVVGVLYYRAHHVAGNTAF